MFYTPPESIFSGEYGIPGDIYQIGMVLYQTVGGHLPYEESAWLNSRELKKYREMTDEIDRQIYANSCIKNRIEKGKIVNTGTLPPWVCVPLCRTISKACNVDPSKRYQSCSEFLARINSIKSEIHDWKIEQGLPVRYGKAKYRIAFDNKKNILYFAFPYLTGKPCSGMEKQNTESHSIIRKTFILYKKIEGLVGGEIIQLKELVSKI